MRSPFVLVTAGVLAVLLIITTIVSVEVSSAPKNEVFSVENGIVTSINEARDKYRGSTPLKLNGRLSEAAAAKQVHMFNNNYWNHQSPTGVQPWDFIRAERIPYATASETLARGFTDPEYVVRGWLDSPTHRETLLNRNFSQIGLSIQKQNGVYDVVALFIQPLSSIAGTSNVLSDTTETPTQTVLAVQQPNLAKIAEVLPAFILRPLLVIMSVSIVLSTVMILNQHKLAPHHRKQRPLHELPELHIVLNISIFMLLAGSVL